jgi:hypothetical protein
MYIEDLICKLNSHCSVNRFDVNLVSSFVNQAFIGTGYTEKQSVLAVRILKRYSASLSAALSVDITTFLDNPTFKFNIRKINNAKRISIIAHETLGKAIKVEFPYAQEKVDSIRKSKDQLGHAVWDSDKKAWIFSVDERNIQFLTSFVESDHFELDEEIKNYIVQIKHIIGNMENYVPMLTIENGLPKYLNQSRFVPELTSKEVIPAVFEARKAGIFTWDEKVTQYLDQAELDPVIRSFLLNESPKHLEIDSTETPVQCLTDIVKYTQPTLFIIPGGSESAKTKMIYNFLTSIGYTSDDMSIMFRLPSSDGKDFNEFVKNCGLNNPITDKTKFVFVSIKLPKPIIKSKMRFNSVISLGRSNVHYTIREFFKNRQNLIYYCEPNKQKEFNFVNL